VTQIAATVKTPLDAAAAERQGNAKGKSKGDTDGAFARFVKDADTGPRNPAADKTAEKAGQVVQKAVQPDGLALDAKAAETADPIPRKTMQGEQGPAASDRTGRSENVKSARHSEAGNGQPILVPHRVPSQAAGRDSASAAPVHGADETLDAKAAKLAEANGDAKSADDAETVQPPAAGPAPVVAVMAVAPYLTARSASADVAGKPAAAQPQRSAIAVERVASGETIDAPVARGEAAPSKAETIDMAFAAGKGRGDGDARFGNAQAGGAQAPAVKIGPSSVEGLSVAVSGNAAPPAGGEVRPPQPVVVPLDLGRALAGEGDLPASMREAVSSHVARVMAAPAVAGQPVSVLRIQLQPAHLGQINVTMRMSGEQMTVTLTPDSASAARALGSDQDTIATVLRSVGGSFAGANIEVAGEGQLRTGGDDTASRSFEGRQGDRSGEGGRGTSSGGMGGSGDGIEPGRSGTHNGPQSSSAEGRIII